MIEKLIGKKDNGIKVTIFDDGRVTIWELMKAGRIEHANLNPEEVIEVKKFLDENLK